jgi:alcohol dehydrogenase class IV
LPAVLRFNEPVAGAKYEALRRTMGLDAGADLAGFVESLNARLGMPSSLDAMGVPTQVFPSIAAAAKADHSTATNPRTVSEAEFEQLLREAS